MADLNSQATGKVDKPCDTSKSQIPEKNGASEQVVKDKENLEPVLPKLSAADFRVYNHMAEHMQYFVGLPDSKSVVFLMSPKAN